MLFLKLLQSLIGTLNSEGTPRQIAAGFALGAAATAWRGCCASPPPP